MQTQPEGSKSGASLSIIIIILIIALGGAYFWYIRASVKPVNKVDLKTKPIVPATSLQADLDTLENIDISTDIKEFEQVYK